VWNGVSNATWSLLPKITLRASQFRLLANVPYWRLHNGSKFGTRLATRADVKRPTMVANGEKQMFRAQSESGAVSGFHAERRLVGSWTLDLEPPVKRNVVPAGSRAESSELDAIGPAVRETLILVWTLQQEFGGDICAHNSPEVCERLDLMCKGGNHNLSRS
jgi:hypothetical protein